MLTGQVPPEMIRSKESALGMPDGATVLARELKSEMLEARESTYAGRR